MSDVKDVIILLCKHFSLSINISIRPECFRLSKYNKPTNNDTEESMWAVLHVLSSYAAKDREHNLCFEDYDEVSATKLYLAFLQYPSIEFYARTRNDGNSRELLLALCWLLATQNVLDIVMHTTLLTSVLAREYSQADIAVKNLSTSSLSNKTHLNTNVQLRNIEHHNSKIHLNLKRIFELLQRKIKLTNKIHIASLSNNNTVHPSVMEVALMKRLTSNYNDIPSDLDRSRLKELRRLRLVLDTHIKWIEKQHIFYDWMISVIEEHKKFLLTKVEDPMNFNEATKFYQLLRHVLTNESDASVSERMLNNAKYVGDLCGMRLFKRLDGENGTNNLLKTALVRQNSVEKQLRLNQMELSQHVGRILSSMSSYIQI